MNEASDLISKNKTWINHRKANSLTTTGSLKEILRICEQYSHDFNTIFNDYKTKLMLFGRNLLDVDVMFQGRVASRVNNEAHVGNIISTAINNDAMSISKACNELYSK